MAQKNNTGILVTGAGGFLGTALSRALATRGNISLAARKDILRIPHSTRFIGDLTDTEYCRKIVKNIDTVYYTAGFKKNIAIHTRTPFEALSGNVLPLLTFLQAAKESDIRKIIYVSSTIVEYASANEVPIDGYVWGKYINEMIMRAFASETGITVTIVRSAPLYGPGDNFDPQTANFIPSFIRRVAEAKDEVVIWGTGERQLQFIYIDDLVSNILAIKQSTERMFTFGNPEKVSVNDVASSIVACMGRTLALRHDTTKPDKETRLSTFKNLVEPKVHMRKGIQKTINYYKRMYG